MHFLNNKNTKTILRFDKTWSTTFERLNPVQTIKKFYSQCLRMDHIDIAFLEKSMWYIGMLRNSSDFGLLHEKDVSLVDL